MEQKISATWIIHSDSPLVLMHSALSRFLYPYTPITEDINSFLENVYNSYDGAKIDLYNFVKNGVLEIIYNPTESDLKRSFREYKKIIDIYIKIREAKFKSLGFIIYDH